jgi:hypothetical protein
MVSLRTQRTASSSACARGSSAAYGEGSKPSYWSGAAARPWPRGATPPAGGEPACSTTASVSDTAAPSDRPELAIVKHPPSRPGGGQAQTRVGNASPGEPARPCSRNLGSRVALSQSGNDVMLLLSRRNFPPPNRSLLESLRIQLILSAKRLGKAFQDTNVSRGNTSGVRFSRCASIPMLHGNRRDDSYALSGADVISALAPLPPPSTSPALSDDANECICQPNVYGTSKADIRTRVNKIAST